VTCDPRVADVSRDCSFDAETAAKVTYVGYVAPAAVDRHAVRGAAHVPEGAIWVVCSGGSGTRAEAHLRACAALAAAVPGVTFDVVLGPRSLAVPSSMPAPANCRVHRERRDLASLHSAADVVVTSGGYNSVIEAASGGARLVVYPVNTGDDDEQRIHAERLGKIYPVRCISGTDELAPALQAAVCEVGDGERPSLAVRLDGGVAIREIVLADLARTSVLE